MKKQCFPNSDLLLGHWPYCQMQISLHCIGSSAIFILVLGRVQKIVEKFGLVPNPPSEPSEPAMTLYFTHCWTLFKTRHTVVRCTWLRSYTDTLLYKEKIKKESPTSDKFIVKALQNNLKNIVPTYPISR